MNQARIQIYDLAIASVALRCVFVEENAFCHAGHPWQTFNEGLVDEALRQPSFSRIRALRLEERRKDDDPFGAVFFPIEACSRIGVARYGDVGNFIDLVPNPYELNIRPKAVKNRLIYKGIGRFHIPKAEIVKSDCIRELCQSVDGSYILHNAFVTVIAIYHREQRSVIERSRISEFGKISMIKGGVCLKIKFLEKLLGMGNPPAINIDRIEMRSRHLCCECKLSSQPPLVTTYLDY